MCTGLGDPSGSWPVRPTQGRRRWCDGCWPLARSSPPMYSCNGRRPSIWWPSDRVAAAGPCRSACPCHAAPSPRHRARIPSYCGSGAAAGRVAPRASVVAHRVGDADGRRSGPMWTWSPSSPPPGSVAHTLTTIRSATRPHAVSACRILSDRGVQLMHQDARADGVRRHRPPSQNGTHPAGTTGASVPRTQQSRAFGAGSRGFPRAEWARPSRPHQVLGRAGRPRSPPFGCVPASSRCAAFVAHGGRTSGEVSLPMSQTGSYLVPGA
jgi:hypothetical protein